MATTPPSCCTYQGVVYSVDRARRPSGKLVLSRGIALVTKNRETDERGDVKFLSSETNTTARCERGERATIDRFAANSKQQTHPRRDVGCAVPLSCRGLSQHPPPPPQTRGAHSTATLFKADVINLSQVTGRPTTITPRLIALFNISTYIWRETNVSTG